LVPTSQEALRLRYKDQPINAVGGNNVFVYSKNHMEHTNILCGQNAEFMNVKADGIYVVTIGL
jgi:hypothetical protein